MSELADEDMLERITEALAEAARPFMGMAYTTKRLVEFQQEATVALSKVCMASGEDLVDHVVIALDHDEDMQRVRIRFEPLDPELRSPRMKITKHQSSGGSGYLFSAIVDNNPQVSGWGVTPIHAVADLQRSHGAN